MSLKKAWLLVRQTAKAYSADNCPTLAAAISYYVLFSIVPLAIVLISLFGLIVRDQDLQEDIAAEIVGFLNIEAGVPVIEPRERAIRQQYGEQGLGEIAAGLDEINRDPDEERRQQIATDLDEGRSVTVAGRELGSGELAVHSDNIVTDTIRGVSRVGGALTVLGLAGMAWSASAMFAAIRRSLNIVFDTEVRRPFVQQKLIDLGLVAGLGLLLGLSIAGTGALRTLRELSDENLGPLSEGTGFFWSVLPFFLPAVFSFAVFLFLYRFVPNVPLRIGDVWPGALLATALFEIMKNGFTLYVANFNNYDVAYGALGGILLFMLWTYLTANILLIGAELAAEYPRVMRGEYAEEAGAAEDSRSLREKAIDAARGLVVHDRERRRR